MPWVTFFADRNDVLSLLRYAEDECGLRIVESAPAFDSEPRHFANVDELASTPDFIGGKHQYLALWSRFAGPPPNQLRIELRPGTVPGHTFRVVLEGCGLFTLHTGLVDAGTLEATSLGWWTERAARAKADPTLLPELVNWPMMKSLGSKLRHRIKRHAVANVQGRLILEGALAFARAGGNLRDPHAPAQVFRVDAA